MLRQKNFKISKVKTTKSMKNAIKTIVFYAVHMLRRTNLKTTLLSLKTKFDSFLFWNSKSTCRLRHK